MMLFVAVELQDGGVVAGGGVEFLMNVSRLPVLITAGVSVIAPTKY
jgi:hypothetical protein